MTLGHSQSGNGRALKPSRMVPLDFLLDTLTLQNEHHVYPYIGRAKSGPWGFFLSYSCAGAIALPPRRFRMETGSLIMERGRKRKLLIQLLGTAPFVRVPGPGLCHGLPFPADKPLIPGLCPACHYPILILELGNEPLPKVHQ